jgi:hypothetical protein
MINMAVVVIPFIFNHGRKCLSYGLHVPAPFTTTVRIPDGTYDKNLGGPQQRSVCGMKKRNVSLPGIITRLVQDDHKNTP